MTFPSWAVELNRFLCTFVNRFADLVHANSAKTDTIHNNSSRACLVNCICISVYNCLSIHQGGTSTCFTRPDGRRNHARQNSRHYAAKATSADSWYQEQCSLPRCLLLNSGICCTTLPSSILPLACLLRLMPSLPQVPHCLKKKAAP